LQQALSEWQYEWSINVTGDSKFRERKGQKKKCQVKRMSEMSLLCDLRRFEASEKWSCFGQRSIRPQNLVRRHHYAFIATDKKKMEKIENVRVSSPHRRPAVRRKHIDSHDWRGRPQGRQSLLGDPSDPLGSAPKFVETSQDQLNASCSYGYFHQSTRE